MENKLRFVRRKMRFKLWASFTIIYFFMSSGMVIADDGLIKLSNERERQMQELTDKSYKKFIEDTQKWIDMVDKQTQEANTLAGFSPIFVKPPLGYWALMRKNDVVCALRFKSLHYEQTNLNHSASEGTYTFLASYEWVAQNDGSGDLSKTNVKFGRGEASQKPNIWRFIRGTRSVECDTLKAKWRYPNLIYLINRDDSISYDPKKSDIQNGIEIALTGWRNISEIDTQDARLVWHRYSPDGNLSHNLDESIMIPVEELPGFK